MSTTTLIPTYIGTQVETQISTQLITVIQLYPTFRPVTSKFSSSSSSNEIFTHDLAANIVIILLLISTFISFIYLLIYLSKRAEQAKIELIEKNFGRYIDGASEKCVETPRNSLSYTSPTPVKDLENLRLTSLSYSNSYRIRATFKQSNILTAPNSTTNSPQSTNENRHSHGNQSPFKGNYLHSLLDFRSPNIEVMRLNLNRIDTHSQV